MTSLPFPFLTIELPRRLAPAITPGRPRDVPFLLGADDAAPAEPPEIVHVLRAAPGEADPAAVLQWAIDVTTRLIERTQIAIITNDGPSQGLRLAAFQAFDGRDGRCPRTLGSGRGRIVAASTEGMAYFAGMLPQDEPLACEEGLFAAVPIWSGDALLGAIAVFEPRIPASTPTHSERAILLAIGRHTGAGLASARRRSGE